MPDLKLFTSESVSEGHPDKLADQISDSILDEMLAQDPNSRVAVETLLSRGLAVIAGEVTTKGYVEIADVVRERINEVGYTNTDYGFDGHTTGVLIALQKQSPDIAVGVDASGKGDKPQGAGDQGMMFGYACDETEQLMPLPITLAHRLMATYTAFRKSGARGLRPDAKSQVTIAYDPATNRPLHIDTIVISAQHDPGLKQSDVQALVRSNVVNPVLAEFDKFVRQDIKYFINPTGIFVIGGPQADTGVTGRKIIVDTYGGYARHGGGAFSGKDPSKVDRSAAYAARFIAKNVVAAGLARQCEIQLAYAIGVAEPVSVLVETFGTNTAPQDEISRRIRANFDLTPLGIIRSLGSIEATVCPDSEERPLRPPRVRLGEDRQGRPARGLKEIEETPAKIGRGFLFGRFDCDKGRKTGAVCRIITKSRTIQKATPMATTTPGPKYYAANPGPQQDPEAQTAYRNFMLMVAVGAFATTFAQTAVIGKQPLQFLLKTHFHLGRTEMAAFFFASQMAWYFKPLAGLLTDAVPLFGTRRRSYMIVASVMAAALWLLLGAVSQNYGALWAAVLILNLFMMIASVSMGALLVEGGQKYGATGRLSSTREFVQGGASLIMGPVAGFLATRWFGYTAGIGAGTLITLAIVAFLFLKEKPNAELDKSVLTNAATQLKGMSKSGPLWAAVGLLLLVFIAPGFNTPLYYLQTDTLKFSQQNIGYLTLLGGLGGILAALTYGWVCKRLDLRTALYAGIVLNATGAIIYLLYHSYPAALAIDFINGYLSILGVLPVYDLAARSVPRGNAALGFSLMMSARNIALFGSDIFGSWLIDRHHVHFNTLVLLNAGTTLLVLIAIPFLPATLLSRRDGEALTGIPAEKTSGGQFKSIDVSPLDVDGDDDTWPPEPKV